MARKAGLGRGLESLLGETAGEVGGGVSSGAVALPIERVHPNPGQPRKDFDEDALEELADSIRQNGLLQPILVRRREGEYQIVAGERRYQAVLRAGLDEVQAVVRDISDEDVLKLALIENLQRTDLNPMEEARGYQELMEQEGLTQEQVAQVVSKSRSAVANALRLLRLPEELQGLVRDGHLTAGHARALLAVEDDETRLRLAKRIVDGGLSVRQTESLVSSVSGGVEHARKASASQVPTEYSDAARRLGTLLNTKVRVRQSRGRNRIEIEFDSQEDLARLMTRFEGGGESEVQNEV